MVDQILRPCLRILSPSSTQTENAIVTIPSKGRRSISVDDVDYYYMVAFERSDRAVVQRIDKVGKSLFVLPFSIMKPSHVADAIRFSKRFDSQEERNATDCWLVFDVDVKGNSHFEHVRNDDFRVVTHSTGGKLPAKFDESKFDDTRPWYSRPKPGSGFDSATKK